MTDTDPDFYTVPPADDNYWEAFIAAGLHQPAPLEPELQPSPNGTPTTPTADLHIVPYTAFANTDEPTAEPLIGTADETLLPANGMLLMYGDGGAGKTTLTIDAICHLAAGQPWIGLTVTRPLRVLLIENEGPRGKLRQRLRQKHDNWDGNPYTDNIDILEEPWQQFTFANPTHRGHLAAWIDRRRIDIVVVGPLASIGSVGGGTPDEVNTFLTLTDATRRLSTHPYALWIVHHENKAGDVSGAWERVPDSLVHIQAIGNGHTKIVWRKTRWSSTLHGTNTTLTWADNHSYTVDDLKPRDLHAELIQHLQNPGQHDGWYTAQEAAKAIKGSKDRVREVLSDLVERGDVEFQQGPPGRHAASRCWRLRYGPIWPGDAEPYGDEDA